MTIQPPAALLTTAEVAALFGKSERWVRNHRRELGQRKVGNVVRYPIESVLAFGGERTPAPTPIRPEAPAPVAPGAHPIYAWKAARERAR